MLELKLKIHFYKISENISTLKTEYNKKKEKRHAIKKMNIDQIKAAFKTFDMNNDGKITMEGIMYKINPS